MPRPPATTRRRKLRRAVGWAIACGLLCALATTIASLLWHRSEPQPQRSEHDVPLGVEEAVVIRYAGPRLVARPYRRGASINLRIAEEVQSGPARVYDVRYVVNQPDKRFDLVDYLASADGSRLDGLPSFPVRGLTSLTKDIETRIREIEDVGVGIWHWYYESLAGLGGLWVLWLVGLIWIGRPKRAAAPPPPPAEPSLAEQIARYLEALARDDLPVEDRARLEILLLRHWRERLRLGQQRMAAACRSIERDVRAGRAYAALQAWLHDPATPVGAAEILVLCQPLVEQ
jgi:hypothetical protein